VFTVAFPEIELALPDEPVEEPYDVASFPPAPTVIV
jgi:hypothetical protein